MLDFYAKKHVKTKNLKNFEKDPGILNINQ